MLSSCNPNPVSTLPSLPPPLTRVSTTGSQKSNTFAGFQKSFAHSSNQQSTCPEWKPFNQKHHLVLWTRAFSLCHTCKSFHNREEEAYRLIGYRITDLVGFKNDLPPAPPTIKSNEPASFLNVPTIQTKIEANHRIRSRILLLDDSSYN